MNVAQQTDKDLNAIYKQIKQQFKSNPQFIQKLQVAETAWIAYRDAYINSIFPSPNHFDDYGSNYTMCYLGRSAEVTSTRTDQLKELLASSKTPSVTVNDNLQIDLKLNDTYNRVVKIYDNRFTDALRQAQLKWIKFRDADADAFASQGAPNASAGLRLQRLVELKKERVKELKQWIDGTEEGDVCAGSIPITRGLGPQ
jgi:uncharacterized protein YecT (DUF1311 family)